MTRPASPGVLAGLTPQQDRLFDAIVAKVKASCCCCGSEHADDPDLELARNEFAELVDGHAALVELMELELQRLMATRDALPAGSARMVLGFEQDLLATRIVQERRRLPAGGDRIVACCWARLRHQVSAAAR